MVLFYLLGMKKTRRNKQLKKNKGQFCENKKTKWTSFICRRTGFIRRPDEASPPADEASPPADEASPSADEASPPADEANLPTDEASPIGLFLRTFDSTELSILVIN